MRTLVALLSVLLLVSCGSSDEPEAADEPTISTTTEAVETTTTTTEPVPADTTTSSAALEAIPGLVAHFPLDGSPDNVADAAWESVAFGPTPAEDRHGVSDGAYLFTGERQHIAITRPAGDASEFGQGITITAWVQLQGGARDHIFWYDVVSFQPGSHVLAVNGTGRPVVGEQGSFACAFVAEGDVLDGEWHHLAMTRQDDLTVRAYLDGVLQDVISQSLPAAAQDHGLCDRKVDWNTTFWIGGDSEYEEEFFVGLIDDVRIYNRALTGEEVRSLFESSA